MALIIGIIIILLLVLLDWTWHNLGTIEKINISNNKFQIGDKVMLTKGADVVEIGEKVIYIYKEDMLIC